MLAAGLRYSHKPKNVRIKNNEQQQQVKTKHTKRVYVIEFLIITPVFCLL